MSGRSTSRHGTEAERRARRLAELVAELTGCERDGALHAVREHQHEDRPDVLGLVARAMIDVDAPLPDGFRIPPAGPPGVGEPVLDLSDRRSDDRSGHDGGGADDGPAAGDHAQTGGRRSAHGTSASS